jgi:hypothetical protein
MFVWKRFISQIQVGCKDEGGQIKASCEYFDCELYQYAQCVHRRSSGSHLRERLLLEYHLHAVIKCRSL